MIDFHEPSIGFRNTSFIGSEILPIMATYPLGGALEKHQDLRRTGDVRGFDLD
jgi:hypothetical protein